MTRPLPQPSTPARPDPARRHGAAAPEPDREAGVPAPSAWRGQPPPHLHLHEGASVEAASSGRQGAPQAAALGHGGAGQPGPGRCRGRRPAGQGHGTDRAGHRLSVLLSGAITSSPCRGRSREAGRGDPTLPPAPGGEGAIVPPSARPSPPLPPPRAPAPSAQAAWSRGMRSRGPDKGASRGVVGWGGDPWAGGGAPASPTRCTPHRPRAGRDFELNPIQSWKNSCMRLTESFVAPENLPEPRTSRLLIWNQGLR